MEVFIVGLIVYVILSVIGEVAKKNKNAPPPQAGGGKVIPFPGDPNARPRNFQDLLREALEEASLEGKESRGGAEGDYGSEGGYQGEGSGGIFGEGAEGVDAAGAGEAGAWLSQRNGSLTGEEIMERMEEGLSSEGFSAEGLSSEGLSSEGFSSLEGAPATDGSLGGDTRRGNLESIPEESHSSGSLLKSSTGSDEFSLWEHGEDAAVDFADDSEDRTDARFSYGEISYSDSGFDMSPAFVRRGLLTSEDDLLNGIIVSEILNTPGGKSRLLRGAHRPNRFVRK